MIHIYGTGAVGRRVDTLLDASASVLHSSRDRRGGGPGDVAVLAHGGPHAAKVSECLELGMDVVTLSDELDDVLVVEALAAKLDTGQRVVVGAAMSPGLSGLLARHQARDFVEVDEISVAVHGTAGPSCARRYHDALSGTTEVLVDGIVERRLAGSGRQLCWFPEPIGGKDCYLDRSVEPHLLHEVFPGVGRISHRRAARRRDRLTARLPMLSPPPTEGAVGGLWVELRGSDAEGGRLTTIVGIAELIATATAATAASFAILIQEGLIPTGLVRPGDQHLPTLALLQQVSSLGVRLQRFTGVPTQTFGR